MLIQLLEVGLIVVPSYISLAVSYSSEENSVHIPVASLPLREEGSTTFSD